MLVVSMYHLSWPVVPKEFSALLELTKPDLMPYHAEIALTTTVSAVTQWPVITNKLLAELTKTELMDLLSAKIVYKEEMSAVSISHELAETPMSNADLVNTTNQLIPFVMIVSTMDLNAVPLSPTLVKTLAFSVMQEPTDLMLMELPLSVLIAKTTEKNVVLQLLVWTKELLVNQDVSTKEMLSAKTALPTLLNVVNLFLQCKILAVTNRWNVNHDFTNQLPLNANLNLELVTIMVKLVVTQPLAETKELDVLAYKPLLQQTPFALLALMEVMNVVPTHELVD
jgi:hypothetical protein